MADDREEAVLASPSVEATVAGKTWRGTAEVLLERGVHPNVVAECLFDQGVEAGPAAMVAREPERVTGVRLAGRAVPGRGTRATFFDDNDGAKLLVTWQSDSANGRGGRTCTICP